LQVIGHAGGIIGYWQSRHEREQINRKSFGSYPGLITLSKDRLRRLCPELFPTWRHPSSVIRWLIGDSLSVVYEIGDILIHGGSGAAVAMSTQPLLVASYSQNIDCVALLRFPDFLVPEHHLQPGSRLLTVLNGYMGGELAGDLEHGPDSRHDLTNFIPFIADFLTDAKVHLEERKAGVADRWWARTQQLGESYMKKWGQRARDGRPPHSWIPALPMKRVVG
jgi:hypothetical protein